MSNASDSGYWDISTGEPVDEDDLENQYRETLNECYGDSDGCINVGVMLEVARVLEEVDPIAYRVGFSDYVSSLVDDTITDVQPEDDDA